MLSSGGYLLRTAFAGALLVGGFAVVSCAGDSDKAGANANGKVTVVYEDNTIKPKDKQAVAVVRKSRVFEQAADWVNKSVALPHDLDVKVTGKVPPGVTDAVTQPDGRTIYVPPPFLTQIQGILSDVVKTVKRPALFPEAEFNADDLTALSTQFIFGHEMGHALQRQLLLPNLGLEEDAADGFASFYTVNEVGPGPSLAAAILFDELARDEGKLTLEGLSSDHPVTQQRVFNFLCYLEGSDPKRFYEPLVGAGYLPKTRAPLCPQAWAMLDYGWWTQLRPHFSEAFKDQGDKTQENARDHLIAEMKAFEKELDKLRRGQ
ncbi:Putative metallopeptidase [Streptomyces sp. cf386]|uniref:DUF4344 domain-containing metallopeptidase n=1 Tax=Streptomyces sp. cf386 TaxID=1761904 RepID=UPI00088AB80A|nr:DUF4344 domain-containing metallopeptidase [Streptomyces sp. cf386]SDO53284.1 Putative metallopeptidase [Streptomyces sp. cf386]